MRLKLTKIHCLIVLVLFAFLLISISYGRHGRYNIPVKRTPQTFVDTVLQLLAAKDESASLSICDTIPDVITESQENAVHTRPKIFDADSKKQYAITLVTAYFPLKKSKHSLKEYKTWMYTFLSFVSTPVVIYADKKNASFLFNQRKGKPTVIFEYDSVWELPPVYKHAGNYLTRQNDLDPEKKIHSPELYAVWNSKPWMLSHVSRLNPFNSTYFFWIDIGCFRKKYTLENWPDVNKVNQVFKNGASNKMQLFAVDRYPLISGNNFTYNDSSHKDVIMATIFGGPAKGIGAWSKLFYYVHDSLLSKGLFVGKDQNLMNYLGILLQNLLIVVCKCGTGGSCEHAWFYFLHWYAFEKEMSPNCFDSSSYFDMVDYIRPTK